jgi:hypothetical protein
MNPIVSWAPISYASSVGFDVIVLLLTIAKLRANNGNFGKSAISKQIYRDNLLYFVVTAATNIAVLTIQGLDDSFALIKPTAVPFSTVITVSIPLVIFLSIFTEENRMAGDNGAARVPQPQTLPSTPAARGCGPPAIPALAAHRLLGEQLPAQADCRDEPPLGD